MNSLGGMLLGFILGIVLTVNGFAGGKFTISGNKLCPSSEEYKP